jgi:CDP-alcohol phosphatidyltransferase
VSLSAVLFHSPQQLKRVAGLTLLERAVLSLRRGGISRVGIVVSPEDRAELDRWLPSSRIADQPPEFLWAGRTSDQELAEVAAGFSATPDLVIHRPVAMDWGFVSGVRAALEQDPALETRTAEGAIWVRPRSGGGPKQSQEVATFGGTAVPVTNRASARLARRTLLGQSIKPLEIDGIVCYLLIRRLSVRLTTLMLPFPITPNLITGLSVLLGVVAGVAVSDGSYLWTVVGGGLLMASLILDNCDGEVARVKHKFSDWGAWFDIYGDFVVNAAFMAGMAVGAWRRFDQRLYLYAGGFTLFAFTFYNGTVFRYIHRLGIPDEFLFKWWFDQEADAAAEAAAREADTPEPVVEPEPGPSGLGRFLSGLKYLGRRDFFIFAYLMTALMGVLHWAFWATVAGTVMNFVMTCYQVFFWKGLSNARQ